jgi:hypothetical protein
MDPFLLPQKKLHPKKQKSHLRGHSGGGMKCGSSVKKVLRHEPPRARTHLTTTKTTSCLRSQVLCESSHHFQTIAAVESRCNPTFDSISASIALDCLMHDWRFSL